MRQRAKVDSNHKSIVDALRAMQWGVWSTAQLGKGFPDLLAVKHGRVVLLEVKDGAKVPSARKLTMDERLAHDWFKRYGVDVLVVEKLEDLRQLDREARRKFEGDGDRNYYPA